MKVIPLTRDQVAFVDDDMFEYLNQWKWYADKCGNTYYTCCNVYNFGPERKHIRIKMHHAVFGRNVQIDHADGNGCNNQKENLREASSLENNRNRKKNTGCSSKYKGVYWNKSHQKWEASIRVGKPLRDGRHCKMYLGNFDSEIEAAKAYDQQAIKFGEFAKLNFAINSPTQVCVANPP
ncbi:AP2 domain-containing protein [Candidatus Pacearchaeota archaeon]|jgi:hypothetical protein|nr:AP2 domain-containing protein [Candidatus Pacearchaeota archaeon]